MKKLSEIANDLEKFANEIGLMKDRRLYLVNLAREIKKHENETDTKKGTKKELK